MKWAINGFGRIGRGILRAAIAQNRLTEVGAIHDFAPIATSAHLLKYDSLFGPLTLPVSVDGSTLHVGTHTIPYFHKLTDAFPWGKLGIDVVLECTGKLTSIAQCQAHLTAGAKRVILSAPSKDPQMKTLVYGVNHQTFDSNTDTMVSNASCTTNCLAPLVYILHKEFGIVHGMMTTVHSYTNDQRLLDTDHSDLRRARASAINMIPTTTGAARVVGKIIPELDGKIDGFALRVPTPNVSFLDFVTQLKTKVDVATVNAVFKKYSTGTMAGILAYTTDPIVSSDLIGSSCSAVVDASLTMCMESDLVKVCAWYDNEMGFSYRMLDLLSWIQK